MLKACLASDHAEPLTTLDIGCGVANSLMVATSHGFEAEGIEVNEHAVSLARQLGRRVHFPGARATSGSFDSVTMWETLEHIADPLSALQTAHAHLKNDGLLALTVPNLNAPDIRSMRGDSLQIHGGLAWPGHINLWTPATLGQLLRRAGFEPVHISGQFSTNLEEFLAYHQGLWSGARDYLRADAPEFTLPTASRQIARALGAAAVSWQEGFAFAPILVVLARKSGGRAPSGLSAFVESAADARRQSLNRAYGFEDGSESRRTRGTALDLSNTDWISEASELQGGRLRLDARGADAFSYLWRSPPLPLAPGSVVRVRGAVTKGGLSAGLLQEDRWSVQSAIGYPGPFELVLPASAGPAPHLLFCNNDNGCGPVEADIDCVELVAPD
ncbi:MAG: methyltransferase domain-containing protein [Alphaproteobacteria bacterium]|nr:methyltransferase domain-containing protein [Alphaproteobacteria bacterium]